MIKNLSVLMPTFNCGKYLSASIKSILNQTFGDFELIIIDDGSTDNTEEIVKQFNERRIRYEKIEHSGIAVALNYGLSISKYDWIARMDADDISIPNRLNIQVNFLNNHPKYNVISCYYAFFKGQKISHVFKLPVDHDDIIRKLRLHSPLCHAGSLFSKNIISNIGGYYKKPFEDYDLWLRISDKALFYNIPEVLILVRSRKDSLHRSTMKKEILSLQRKYFGSNLNRQNTSHEKYGNNNIEGWREWFYGDKKKARKFWGCNALKSLTNVRILFAFIISFLPDGYFERIKDFNLKARINYYLYLDKHTKKKLRSFIISQS